MIAVMPYEAVVIGVLVDVGIVVVTGRMFIDLGVVIAVMPCEAVVIGVLVDVGVVVAVWRMLVDLGIVVAIVIGRMLVDQGIVVVIGPMFVDLGVVVVMVMVLGTEHDRSVCRMMMRREMVVHRDVHPRHELEARDPQDAERERDARSCRPRSRWPHPAHRVSISRRLVPTPDVRGGKRLGSPVERPSAAWTYKSAAHAGPGTSYAPINP